MLRGGYGIYYLLEDGNIAFNNTGTIPYGGSVSVVNTTPRPSFLIDDPFSTGVASLPAPGAFYRDTNNAVPLTCSSLVSVSSDELPWSMVAEANIPGSEQ